MTENQDKKQLFTIQDIFDETDKQIPMDITKVYDPLHFWDDFGDKYFRGFKKIQDVQRNVGWIVHKMKALNVKTLLDVGCGFCRLEPFILDGEAAQHVTAIDISQKQLDSSAEYLKDYPQDKRDKIKIEKASVKHLPYERGEFDAALSSECMMHLMPPRVRYAIAELYRVIKLGGYLMITERFVFPGEHIQPHVWSHDYVKLLSDSGFAILEAKLIANGTLAIIAQKK